MLRRRRRIPAERRQLRRAGQLSGSVQHPSGDGAGVARGRAEAAPAHPAGQRRKLRHQAVGLSLHRAGGDRGAHHRPAGQMGRGPARASAGCKLGPQPHHRDRSRGHQGRPHPGAAARSARRLRRVPARAHARPALPHARRADRSLRHCQCRRDQPRRADQQDAGEPDPRIRRAAALPRARAAGAADRDRAQARPPRRAQAQSRSQGEVSVQGGRRLALRFGRLSACGRDRDRRRTSRRPPAPARRGAGRRPALRHRVRRRGRARHVQHGLPLHAAHARGARQGRSQERGGVDGHGQYRSARRGLGDRRRHRAGAGA